VKASFIQNKKPYGFIYGKWFLGYISKGDDQKNTQILHIILKQKIYTNIKKEQEVEITTTGEEIKQEFIKILERRGNYYWFNFPEREYNTTKYLGDKVMRPEQNAIINDIISITQKKPANNGTFFIYGKPGSGKSLMLLFLAKKLNAYYCDTWNPTDPGDSINNLYSDVNPTKENPLLVVLEEADCILLTILKQGIEPHKNIPIEVRNKSGWNKLLDKITDLAFYPNLILVLTSNISYEDINALDSSVLRKGRTTKCYTMLGEKTD